MPPAPLVRAPKDGIRDTAAGVEDPTENDPLYSSFTRNKEFDPNTGLPPHKQIYPYGANPGKGKYAPRPSPTELEEAIGGDPLEGFETGPGEGAHEAENQAAGSQPGETMERPERPKTAKGGYTGSGETPLPGAKAKQRPMTSLPSNRRNGQGKAAKGAKKARPWTTTGTREIAAPAQPLSLSVPRPATAKRDIHSAGVRSGAWQILNCTPALDVAIGPSSALPEDEAV